MNSSFSVDEDESSLYGDDAFSTASSVVLVLPEDDLGQDDTQDGGTNASVPFVVGGVPLYVSQRDDGKPIYVRGYASSEELLSSPEHLVRDGRIVGLRSLAYEDLGEFEFDSDDDSLFDGFSEEDSAESVMDKQKIIRLRQLQRLSKLSSSQVADDYDSEDSDYLDGNLLSKCSSLEAKQRNRKTPPTLAAERKTIKSVSNRNIKNCRSTVLETVSNQSTPKKKVQTGKESCAGVATSKNKKSSVEQICFQTDVKKEITDEIEIKEEVQDDHEFIGVHCHQVGCTVTWLESMKTKFVTVNNGIVYELSEFAKKINWERIHVAEWILRLRGILDIEPTQEDLEKIHIILKRRKALAVTLSGCKRSHVRLYEFDNTEFTLPSSLKVESKKTSDLKCIRGPDKIVVDQRRKCNADNIFVQKLNNKHEVNVNDTNTNTQDNQLKPHPQPSTKKAKGVTKESSDSYNTSNSENSNHLENTEPRVSYYYYRHRHCPYFTEPHNYIGPSCSVGGLTIDDLNFMVEKDIYLSEGMIVELSRFFLERGCSLNDLAFRIINMKQAYEVKEESLLSSFDLISEKANRGEDLNAEFKIPVQNAVLETSEQNKRAYMKSKNLKDARKRLDSDDHRVSFYLIQGSRYPVFNELNFNLGKYCSAAGLCVADLNSKEIKEVHVTQGVVSELYDFYKERSCSLKSLAEMLLQFRKGAAIKMSSMITAIFILVKRRNNNDRFMQADFKYPVTKFKPYKCAGITRRSENKKTYKKKYLTRKSRNNSVYFDDSDHIPEEAELFNEQNGKTDTLEKGDDLMNAGDMPVSNDGSQCIERRVGKRKRLSSQNAYDPKKIKMSGESSLISKGIKNKVFTKDLPVLRPASGKEKLKTKNKDSDGGDLENKGLDKENNLINSEITDSESIPDENERDKPGSAISINAMDKKIKNGSMKTPDERVIFVDMDGQTVPQFTETNFYLGYYCKASGLTVSVLNSRNAKVAFLSNGAVLELYHFYQDRGCTNKNLAERILSFKNILRTTSVHLAARIPDVLKIQNDPKKLKKEFKFRPARIPVQSDVSDSFVDKEVKKAQGKVGSVTRADIVLLYNDWLKKKSMKDSNVFVTDLLHEVAKLLEARKIPKIRIPAGTLMSSSVKLYEEYRELWKSNKSDALSYLQEDWLEDIQYLVSITRTTRRGIIDAENSGLEAGDDNSLWQGLQKITETKTITEGTLEENPHTSGGQSIDSRSRAKILRKIEGQTPLKWGPKSKRKSAIDEKKFEDLDKAIEGNVMQKLSSGFISGSESLEHPIVRFNEGKLLDLSQKNGSAQDSRNKHCEIEKILDYKCFAVNGSKKEVLYLVRRSGCGSEEDSWVEEQDLKCPKHLKSFWKESTLLNRYLCDKVKWQTLSPPKDLNFAKRLDMLETFKSLPADINDPITLDINSEEEMNDKENAPDVKMECGFGSAEPKIKRGYVTNGQLLQLYDTWRKDIGYIADSENSNKLNIKPFISNVDNLFSSCGIVNKYSDCLLQSCFLLTLTRRMLSSKEAIRSFLDKNCLPVLERGLEQQSLHIVQTWKLKVADIIDVSREMEGLQQKYMKGRETRSKNLSHLSVAEKEIDCLERSLKCAQGSSQFFSKSLKRQIWKLQENSYNSSESDERISAPRNVQSRDYHSHNKTCNELRKCGVLEDNVGAVVDTVLECIDIHVNTAE